MGPSAYCRFAIVWNRYLVRWSVRSPTDLTGPRSLATWVTMSRFLEEVTHAAHDRARPKCTAVPSSADADVGLHQRIDPLGQPQQRGAERAVQRELVAAVKQGVAQLREAALDEAALKEPEAAQRTEGVGVAERDQCAEIAEAEWGERLVLSQPSRQVADQMQGLLVGDLGGGGQL